MPDCVYLTDNGRCGELKVKKCKGGGCGFCVTREGIREAARTWSIRLSSLSGQKQEEIANKYYGGQMPWKQ